MSADEEQAVTLLNDVKLETDGNSKVDKLKALFELVVNKDPGLLASFLPEVAELQVDPAPQVRKYLPDFLAGAAKARPTAEVLLQCIQCVLGLLRDEVVAAAKQAVLMCNPLFRTVLSLVVASGGVSQHVEQLRLLWEAAEGLKSAVAALALQHKNDGIRMNAAKFIEQAILLLTADTFPGVPGAGAAPDIRLQGGNQVLSKSSMVKDAEGLLSQLVALLKLRLGEDVAGPVAIVVVKSAGALAQHRPQFVGKLLPPLLALANSGTYKAEGGESGLQSSIAAALKGSLVGVLRCTDPRAAPWQKKVVEAMHAMGAGALADSTVKQVLRGNKRSSSEEPEGAKRARMEGPAQQQQQQQQLQHPVQQVAGRPQPTQQEPTQHMPMQVPPGQPTYVMQQQQQPVPLAGTPPLPAQPPPTSQADLQRVLTVAQQLVMQGNGEVLATIIGGLQPVVLADVVLALASTLPPRHLLPPDHAPLEPWALEMLRRLEQESWVPPLPALAQQLQQLAMPAVVQQPLPQPRFQPQVQPGLPSAGHQFGLPPGAQLVPPLQQQQQYGQGLQPPGVVQPSLAAPPGGGPPMQPPAQAPAQALPGRQPTPPPIQSQPPLQQQQQQQQQQQPPLQPPPQQQQAAEPAAPPPPVPPPKAAPRPPPAPTFELAPLQLTPQQQLDMRKAAVMRILSSRQVASPALQRALVARLAASSSSSATGGDGLGDAVLQFLLEDFAGRGGFELCMQWLNALFAGECKPLPAASSGGGGSGAGTAGVDTASLAEFVNSGLDSFGIEGFLGVKAEEPQQRSPSVAGGVESRPATPLASGITVVNGQGGGGSAAGGEGGPYQVVLLALLEGLREALPPSDKTIVRVLLEVPALPMPATRHFLRDMCSAGPDWATLALLAARDIIDQRPPSRQQVLGFVLEAASDPTPDVISKAVRLTANRLFPQPAITAAIERHARQQLDSMVVWQPRPGSVASQLPAGSPCKGAAAEGDQAAAAAAARVEQAAAQAAQHAQRGQQAEEGGPGAGADPSAQVKEEGQDAAAAAGASSGPDAVTASQLCTLYCALCTKKHSLLRHLFEVYGRTSDGGRAAIRSNAPGLAKALGASAAALLAVVQDPPEGSLSLVVSMLDELTKSAPAPAALVAAGRQLFANCHDPRVLPPLLPAMDKAAVLRLLPALLDLPAEFKKAARQMVTPPPGGAESGLGPLFQPSELLVALHTLDYSQHKGLLLKMAAGVDTCIKMGDLFGQEALAATISQLLTRAPLPAQLMRTVIQSLAAHSKLRPFVVRTLVQLVGRRVWEDANLWKGWLLCARTAAPESFPAWLQLPTAVLGRALQGLPEPFKRQLAAHTASPQCTQAVPRPTLDLLRPYLPQEEGAKEEKG